MTMKTLYLVLAFARAGVCLAQSSVQIQTNGPVAGVPFAGNIGTAQPFTAKVVTGRPFIADAVVQTDQTLADGSHVVNQQTSTAARDSQGRTYREEILASPAGGGQQLKTVFIRDPVAQVNYVLGPDQVARKIPMSMPGAQSGVISISTTGGVSEGALMGKLFRTARSSAGDGIQTAPPGAEQVQPIVLGETKTEQLGTQMIGGAQADGSRTTLTIPVGRVGNQNPLIITDERWFSQELQATVLSKHTDPRFGISTYQLTNIQRTEPPVSMFQVPSDYFVEEPQSR